MSNPGPAPKRSASPKNLDFLSSSVAGSTTSPQYSKQSADHLPIIEKEKRPEFVDTHKDTHHDTDTEATHSSDEFDWDTDEDEDEKKPVVADRKAKRGRRLWLLFLKLSRPVRTLLLAVIVGGIAATPALVFMFRFPDNGARKTVVPWSLWVAISFAIGCGLSLLVELFPRFFLYIVFLVYGIVPETLKTPVELFMAVTGWLKTVLHVSAAWICLGFIRRILQPPGRYWYIINQVMEALFATTIILLFEKIFVRIVAIQFHQKALADRLHENRIALKALDKLSTATPKVKPKRRRSPGGSLVFGGSNPDSPHPSRPVTPELHIPGDSHRKDYTTTTKSGMSTPPDGEKKKAKKRSKSKVVTNVLVDQLVDLRDAIGELALKDSRFNKEAEIGSLYSARRLARQLFSTLSSVYPPRQHLIVDDFHPYFRSEADAKVAFGLFDKDDNGDISKQEMREAVQRIYRERKALSASLKDMSSAVAKLDAVMVGVSLIIICFICLLIFQPSDSISSLIPLATIVLGFSFVFGNSAKTIFESLIFIFSTHVYDVGDIVLIDDQVLTVKEFGLFATTFRRVDGQEVLAPNSLLATTKLIHNCRRSGSMWESTSLGISYETPLEIIEQLKVRLRQYMTANNREWGSPGVEIWIDSMKFQNCINLTIAIEHRQSFQEWGARWGRRNLFMKHLRTVLEELEIGYSLPLQPVSFHPSSIPPPFMQHQHSPVAPRDPMRAVVSQPTPTLSLDVGRF